MDIIYNLTVYKHAKHRKMIEKGKTCIFYDSKKWLHYSLEIFEQFTLFSFVGFRLFIFYFFETLQVKFRRDQKEAQIWLVPLKIVFNVSRFKPALNWNLFLADLRRGSNSLNSDSVWSNFITLKSLLFSQNQICSNIS